MPREAGEKFWTLLITSIGLAGVGIYLTATSEWLPLPERKFDIAWFYWLLPLLRGAGGAFLLLISCVSVWLELKGIEWKMPKNWKRWALVVLCAPIVLLGVAALIGLGPTGWVILVAGGIYWLNTDLLDASVLVRSAAPAHDYRPRATGS